MPDITMCAHPWCRFAHQCSRHEASGTKPGAKQSVMDFEPGADGCDWFVPKIEERNDA